MVKIWVKKNMESVYAIGIKLITGRGGLLIEFQLVTHKLLVDIEYSNKGGQYHGKVQRID